MVAAQGKKREKIERFVESLASEERMLVLLKRELYEGSWDEMVADLQARLQGRPYIFKLANRIVDDLDRIDRLRGFERQYQVDLDRIDRLRGFERQYQADLSDFVKLDE